MYKLCLLKNIVHYDIISYYIHDFIILYIRLHKTLNIVHENNNYCNYCIVLSVAESSSTVLMKNLLRYTGSYIKLAHNIRTTSNVRNASWCRAMSTEVYCWWGGGLQCSTPICPNNIIIIAILYQMICKTTLLLKNAWPFPFPNKSKYASECFAFPHQKIPKLCSCFQTP